MALAACLVLAAGYQFWLRDSSLVAVEQVKVTGLTTKDAARVRAALVSAAHTMTTLHVDQRRARADAIAAYPVVRALEVQRRLPAPARIRVIEHVPAAIAVGAGLPVAGDGTILRGLPVEGRCRDERARRARRRPPVRSARAPRGRTWPAARPLRCGAVSSASTSARRSGIVVELRDGPELLLRQRHARARQVDRRHARARRPRGRRRELHRRAAARPPGGGRAPGETLAPVAPAGRPTSRRRRAPHRPLPGWIRPPSSSAAGDHRRRNRTHDGHPAGATDRSRSPRQPAPAPTDSTGAGGAAASRITLTRWLSFRATLDRSRVSACRISCEDD